MPIILIFLILFLSSCNTLNTFNRLSTHKKPFSLMLEPAGDAKHAGREIDDCFERGITLQFCQTLKKSIETENLGLRIILSRFPGESLEPLQNANFANRLDVDLYISIHFFEQTDNTMQLHCFYFCTNPITDFWQHSLDRFSFIPADQIHRLSIHTSNNLAHAAITTLKTYQSRFASYGPFGIPFKPLFGICSPAIAFEISLVHSSDWKYIIEPLKKTILSLYQQIKSNI